MGFAILGKGRFYGWVALTAAAFAYFIVIGLVFSFGAFLPSICREFGWGRGLVSGAYSMLVGLMGLSAPLAGFFIGKYGPRKAIIIGNTMGASGLLLLAFHSQVWQLYVGYGVLMGLGAGLGGIIPSTTIANNWFRKKVTLAMSIATAAGGIGGQVMSPLIMPMLNNIGLRSTYLVLCGIMVLFGVIIPGLFIRNKPEDLGQVPDGVASSDSGKTDLTPKIKQYVTQIDFTVKEAMGTGTLWLLIITVITGVFLVTMLMAHQVAFLEGIGISAGIAATTLGLFAGVSTIGKLAMGFLAVKYNLKMLKIIGPVLMLLSMIVALMTRSLPMAFVYTIIGGLGTGASVVVGISLLSSYFGRRDYPKIMGIIGVFSIIIGSTGAAVAGVIYDATKSYTLAFTIGLVVAAIGLLCMIFVRPPVHPSPKEKSANA